jgi:hypothetical protein
LITGSLLGLVILLSSYLVLNLINPRLTEFSALTIQTVEPVELEDEEVGAEEANQALVSEGQSDTPTPTSVPSSGGPLIQRLIGPYKGFAACSKEGAQDAAKKLTELSICVGPCHCAWTGSRFLRYIGCGNPHNGSTFQLSFLLENKMGWVGQTIDAGNKGSLPVGMLLTPGHTGVSIGDGQDFESAPNNMKKINSQLGISCPTDTTTAMSYPERCSACAKLIPTESPARGSFVGNSKALNILRNTSLSVEQKNSELFTINAKGKPEKNLSFCNDTQAWASSSLTSYWKVVVSPANQAISQPVRGCCVFKKKEVFYWGGNKETHKSLFATQALCNMYIKDGAATKFDTAIDQATCDAQS